MLGDPAVWRPDVDVRPACPPADLSALLPRSAVGRLVDLFDALLWPVATTFASVLPRRLSRLIRTEDNPNTEDDVVG